MPRHRRSRQSLPTLLTQLTLASWETIARRTWMMVTDQCSPAEYRRMVREKEKAARLTGAAIARGNRSPSTLLAPWHARATANAKRLRRS